MAPPKEISHPGFHPDLLQHFPRRTIWPNLGLPGPTHRGPKGLPDLHNVQGDVFLVFPKAVEYFIFFTITEDVQAFKNALASYKPTTSRDVLDNLRDIAVSKRDTAGNRIDIVQKQLALSRSGLNKLGRKEKTLDVHFDKGPMIKEKPILGDGGEWSPVFKDGKVDGVFIVAAEKAKDCIEACKDLVSNFSLVNPVIIRGKARPGKNKGHEHFGYEDGASQPALRGLVKPHKGQLQVDPGVIIMGHKGDPFFDDPDGPQRPAWTKDGTIMVFRKLEQDVIGFERYLTKNGSKWREWLRPDQVKEINPPLTDQEGAELFGARLVGRWKSGAPLAKAPYRDNLSLTNQDKTNDFDYRVPGQTGPSDRICPFSAHTRKTAPRNLDPYIQRKTLESAVIVRSGIPYGPEVTQAERDNYDPNAKSPRGLLFVCYQSTVENGFMAQTIRFAADDYFPPTSSRQIVGPDPIIGGPSTNDLVKKKLRNQEFFVTSRGGEYFFVPSVSMLKALSGVSTSGASSSSGSSGTSGITPGQVLPAPTTKGVYRIRLLHHSPPWYMELVPGGNPYVKLTTLDRSTDLQKWIITSTGQKHHYRINSFFDQSGIVKSTYGYWGYNFPIPNTSGHSDVWVIRQQTHGKSVFSKITKEGNSNPLDNQGDRDAVHFYYDNDSFHHQRWVFEFVKGA